MAGIKQPISDILTELKTITDFQFVRVWNNQLQYLEQQQQYSFPFPACFLETIPSNFTRIGSGCSQADIIFKVHIAHELYDAVDGTFEQDLKIFDLRDAVIAALSNFKPTACSVLNLTTEAQDYEHTNLYHYTLDFNCAFIDNKGSRIYTTKSAPTGIEIDFTSELVNEGIITEDGLLIVNEAGVQITTQPHK